MLPKPVKTTVLFDSTKLWMYGRGHKRLFALGLYPQGQAVDPRAALAAAIDHSEDWDALYADALARDAFEAGGFLGFVPGCE